MVVFSYASLLPAGLYGFLWWAGQSTTATISFLELLCLYGYSLTIYIPVSLLWLIQVETRINYLQVQFQGGPGGGGNIWDIFLISKYLKAEPDNSVFHSHWLRSKEAHLLLVESFSVAYAVLCHKEPARRIQSSLIAGSLWHQIAGASNSSEQSSTSSRQHIFFFFNF